MEYELTGRPNSSLLLLKNGHSLCRNSLRHTLLAASPYWCCLLYCHSVLFLTSVQLQRYITSTYTRGATNCAATIILSTHRCAEHSQSWCCQHTCTCMLNLHGCISGRVQGALMREAFCRAISAKSLPKIWCCTTHRRKCWNRTIKHIAILVKLTTTIEEPGLHY